MRTQLDALKSELRALSPSSAPEALTRHRDALEDALRAAIGDSPDPLVASARYVMGWEAADGSPANNGGKRIRPALCLLAAELCGGTVERAMPGAVAVELVHNFSLVHDEVQDHDAERHHRPTLWALLGTAQAINSGNFLANRATQALLEGEGDPQRRSRALHVLTVAVHRMITGQWSDLAFEDREDVTVEAYLDMVAGKTGALLGAPFEMGALLAGATPETAAAFGRWGEQVGLAFQAQDDYLGVWGDPAQTGKSNTNDIARRKKSLPIIHGFTHPASREQVRTAYAGTGELDSAAITQVTAALDAAGAAEATKAQAQQYAARAEKILESLPLGEDGKDLLRAIATYLVERAG